MGAVESAARARSKSEAHIVRFSEVQEARLQQVLAKKGCTFQSFLNDVATIAVDEELGTTPPRKKPATPAVAARPPQYMSLRDRMGNAPLPSYDPNPKPIVPLEPAQMAPQQQITINTGGSGVPELDRMAAYIVKGGPSNERETRLKTIVTILTVTAKDEAEKIELGKALDQKIAVVEGTKPAPQSALSFIGDLFGL